ncbi:extensin family protein [Steroidobacter sp. S1-65]|uniref:Extensin family protein n=1 Tax=Steroidobacter gossypii TaxID=2805490 RepID=A0ABS1X4F9_9GAMM|nr:extensin family protein [Steroidobacter gossypii]MBM0108097.1 extensin family protein [Steroidobacter gossypii]
MRLFIILLVIVLAVAGALYGVRSGMIAVPPDWNPWATLDVNAEPNFLTRHKLARLSKSSELCQQVLATTNLKYARVDDRTTGPACGFFNAVRIEKTSAAVGKPFSLSCRAAVSLAMWERHVLAPAAQAHFGKRVASLEHFGSYSCRNVYGRANATRSQHATAEALDLAGFVLEDGERIRVLKDWNEGGARAAFLRDVRTGACRFFDGVLSPDYNAAHRDHFHFDRGPYRVCR